MFKINMKTTNLPHNVYKLPRTYQLVSVLGRGGFGEVLKCIKMDTKETVAVKIPQHHSSLKDELNILKLFKKKKVDNTNIIRFIDSVKLTDRRVALVFEMMEVTLRDYFMEKRDFIPLHLHEVRAIIKQSANALKALKDIQVIHADIKLDNIMLNTKVQPITVKLIDFGLAFPARKAGQGDIFQVAHYRAPEVMLGLPYSECVDMWSLGVVMGYIALGASLFPGYCDYDTVKCMVDLLGVPTDNLLRGAIYSKEYFVRSPTGDWRVKTRGEYWGDNILSYGRKMYSYRKLDEVENLGLANMRTVSKEEKKMCIDLLKRMLQLDAKLRITPQEVLDHPFITWSAKQQNQCNKTTKKAKKKSKVPRKLPPRVILVKPAKPQNCYYLEENVEHQRETCPAPKKQHKRPLPPRPKCHKQQKDTRVDKQPEQKQKQKQEEKEEKKQKKKGFKRFTSWLRRAFGCNNKVGISEG